MKAWDLHWDGIVMITRFDARLDWFQWAISLPSELSAMAIIIKYWWNIPSWIPSLSMLLMLLAINLYGVRGFGETEYILSGIKVLAVLGMALSSH